MHQNRSTPSGAISRAVATRFAKLIASVAIASFASAAAVAAPQGTLTWGIHLSLTSRFFDPGETPGTGAPLLLQYAQHDALIRPVAGKAFGLSLAESMSQSADGLMYEFKLRRGLKFQNGDPLTAEDVKFSFDRYRGAGATLFKEKVAAVEVVDPITVRYRMKKPWPDFMTFFGTTATGAAWVLPKKYLERVGDDEFKKAPIGAGPYKLVSFKPGTEFVFEASEHYWRKVPNVKTLVFKVIPDATTRLAAIKRGEIDFTYGVQGELASEVLRTPHLKLKTASIPVTNFIIFGSQYDKASPWSDPRVRLAANLALDRKAINQAAYVGMARESNSIIPHAMQFYWDPPAYPYDPARAKKLLAEAGHPNGFDGGILYTDATEFMAEPVQAYLAAVGIRMQLRPTERAAHLKQTSEKKLTGLIFSGSGSPGSASTRLDQFVRSSGSLSYIRDDDLDKMIEDQSQEVDAVKRKAKIERIQQLIHERVRFMPVMEYAFPIVIGPRVGFDGVNGIPDNPYTGPYEDLTIQAGK
ncbi:MAG: ABC transporter substrate-binding protein [Burkholderiaceae bacterium]|nr:ABC transporter substrate-binding protein [Burkholderiaceae bacterium]